MCPFWLFFKRKSTVNRENWDKRAQFNINKMRANKMGTRKVYDLAVKVGSYTNQSGETKNRYQNVGAVMQRDDGGKFLMLAKWFNPAGVPDERNGESIIISMFEPKDKQVSSESVSYAPPMPPPVQAQLGDDDDIPF